MFVVNTLFLIRITIDSQNTTSTLYIFILVDSASTGINNLEVVHPRCV